MVFYLVEQARGSALPPEQARKVEEEESSKPKPPAEPEDDAPHPSLVARLSAYSATRDKQNGQRQPAPPERNGPDDAAA